MDIVKCLLNEFSYAVEKWLKSSKKERGYADRIPV